MEQLTLNRATEIVLEALAAPDNATPTQVTDQGRNVLAHYSRGNEAAANALALFHRDPQNQALRPYVVQQLVVSFTQQQAAGEAIIALAQQILKHRPRGDSNPRGGLNFGSGNQFGDLNFGDIAGRDIVRTEITQGDRISTGDISGSGSAIGHGARNNVRNIDTGGGDYAEGNIDNRKGEFVSGDQINLSGTFSGAIVNVKSTLTNVAQSIGAAPHGDTETKSQLQTLIEQLSVALQQAPAEQAAAAEEIAKRAESAVAEATKPKPDAEDVTYSLSRLQKAAENIGKVLPQVLPIAMQIAAAVKKLTGL